MVPAILAVFILTPYCELILNESIKSGITPCLFIIETLWKPDTLKFKMHCTFCNANFIICKRQAVLLEKKTRKVSIWTKANCPLRDRNQNTLLFNSRMTLTSKWLWSWDNLDHDMALTLMTTSVPQAGHRKFGVQQFKKLISPEWPWPLPNDLDTQTWPRYGQDVPPYQKLSFYAKAFKSYSPNGQTDSMKTLASRIRGR